MGLSMDLEDSALGCIFVESCFLDAEEALMSDILSGMEHITSSV
jgi:hypothetical protein